MKRKKFYFLLILALLSACVQQPIQNHNAAQNNLELAVEYMRRGEINIALKKLKKALNADSNYADAHNIIAVLYDRKLGKKDQAQWHYQRALTLKPKDPHIHNNYGQFLCQHNQWEKAEQHFLKALEDALYKTPELPYINAGLCALDHNHLGKADTYLRKALQKNPNIPIALYKMAKLSYQQKRYLEAYDYLQRYLAFAKQTAQTLWLGIRIAHMLNNQDLEASYTLLLRRQFPDSDEIRLLNRLK